MCSCMGKRKKSRLGAISIKELGLNVPITWKTGIAGYVGYKWAGPKVSDLVANNKIPFIDPAKMPNASAIGKAVIGIAVIGFVPKNWKMGYADEINAMALGLTFNAAEEFAKGKGWISRPGNMRVLHKKGMGGSPQNYGNPIGGSPQNSSIAI